MSVHPTAVVDAAAQIDPTATVGPYAVIEGHVKIGPEARIYNHAYLTGWTEIGAKCAIHPFATVGHLPQDWHYEGERSYCRIGEGTVVREYASVHRGTGAETATVVGAGCNLLAGSHIGHNCVVGDRVTLINYTSLAGHVQVGEATVFSAFAGVHQFCRVGAYAMVVSHARLVMDALPFMTTGGDGLCSGPNLVGMKRNGFSRDEIAEIARAHKLIYRSGKLGTANIASLQSSVNTRAGRILVEFMIAPSKRGMLIGPRHAHRKGTSHDDGNPYGASEAS